MQRKNYYQLKAHTPHGFIEYSCRVNLINTASLVPYMEKRKCEALCETGCPNYANKWSCPPYAPDFVNFVKSYQYIDVIMLLAEMGQFDYIRQDYLKIKAANSILKSRVDKALRLAMGKDEFYISTGSCRLCKPCKRKLNEGCAHPKERTYSFEALGMNVSLLTEELFQTELLWYKKQYLPEYTCVVAGLLTNNEVPDDKVVRQLIDLE